MKKTYVFGHKNPDTDSVTGAIALSYLKNKLGMNTEPRILGDINKETKYALEYYNVPTPKFLSNVKVQIEDVPYKRNLMINENSSIYEAYTNMVEDNITGIPVVKENKEFIGYVSLKEIAADFIKGDFDYLNSSYKNILEVLKGKEITKFDDTITGTITAATYSSTLFMTACDFSKNQIVIVGNRRNVIDYCIDKKAKLIILVGDQELTTDEKEAAIKNRVNVIKTAKMSFEVSKLIGLANYIKTIVRNENPVVFTPSDYLTDFYEISNKLKHTNYPIINKKNKCYGMLRLVDVNRYDKKQIILVDHNEIKQSADGLDEASILEIVDHHAIGNLTTNSPISFRNMIVGSVNTIIYKLFKEANVKIPQEIAGLMLSGLLSDTLILKSPTTTSSDVETARYLARIAKVDIQKYGMDMLKAGSSLEGLSIEDIVFSDYKEFETNGMNFGIGQVLTLDYDKILNRKEEFIEYLDKTMKIKGFKLIVLYITDIVNNGSYVIYTSNAEQIMKLAYNEKNMKQGHYLPGVISRKKQMVPPIMEELNNM